MKEARRIHESLKSVKDDTFATLVSRSMPRGRRAPLHDGTRMREGTTRVAVGEVIDDFRGQFDNFTDIFEAIVFMAPGR